MATEDTIIVHPGDIIQGTAQGPQHGHLFLVTEPRATHVGALARWHQDGDDHEHYHRFKPGTFAVVGEAAIMPPELLAARRDSIRTQREVERERERERAKAGLGK